LGSGGLFGRDLGFGLFARALGVLRQELLEFLRGGVVVDAADRAVREQQTVRDASAKASDDEPGRDDSVRHLDLAE